MPRKPLIEHLNWLKANMPQALDGLQVFDLSKADALIGEMANQYKAVPVDQKLPASACLFFTGDYAVLAFDYGESVQFEIIETLMYNMEAAYQSGRITQAATELQGCNATERALLMEHGYGDLLERLDSGRIFEEMPKPKDATILEKTGETSLPQAIYALCCAEFINLPISKVGPSELPRQTRRRIERSHPGVRLSTVNLSPSAHRHSQGSASENIRALHFCRGHWRRDARSMRCTLVNGEWRIWIDGHWRGDPEKGVVLHNYVATWDDVQQRSKMI